MDLLMFDHEKLHVYQASIEFAAWAHELAKTLKGLDRSTRDQLVRASQSIPLNIAESSGKRPSPDRNRFLHIAYGSALESAAILDVIVACKAAAPEPTHHGKALLVRIVSMLVRMTASCKQVREDRAEYGCSQVGDEMQGEDESSTRTRTSTSTSTEMLMLCEEGEQNESF
jgi:four helix bundle protein